MYEIKCSTYINNHGYTLTKFTVSTNAYPALTSINCKCKICDFTNQKSLSERTPENQNNNSREFPVLTNLEKINNEIFSFLISDDILIKGANIRIPETILFKNGKSDILIKYNEKKQCLIFSRKRKLLLLTELCKRFIGFARANQLYFKERKEEKSLSIFNNSLENNSEIGNSKQVTENNLLLKDIATIGYIDSIIKRIIQSM